MGRKRYQNRGRPEVASAAASRGMTLTELLVVIYGELADRLADAMFAQRTGSVKRSLCSSAGRGAAARS